MRRTRRGSARYTLVSPWTDTTDRAPCFETSVYQDLIWRETFEHSAKDERAEIQKVRIPGFARTFGAEIVHRLSADPVRPVPADERSPFAATRAMLHDMVSLPTHVRDRCVGRPTEAARVAFKIMLSIVHTLQIAPEVTDLERTEQERQAAKDLGLDGGGGGTPGEGESGGEPGGSGSGSGDGASGGAASGLTPDEVKQVQAESDASRAYLNERDLDQHIKDASAHAASQAAPAQAADAWAAEEKRGGTGGGGNGGAGSKSPDLTLTGMAISHPELKRVLALAGRLVPVLDRLADDKRARTGMGRSRIDPTTEIARLTTQERASLSGIRGGIVSADTFRRMSEGSTLGYQGEDPRGEGPIVVCLDQSGSMGGEGSNEWAQAVALAILVRASRTGRKVAIVPYDTKIKPEYVRAWSKRPTVDAAADALTCYGAFGGGTSWSSGITAALDLIEHAGTGRMKKADIVHVTDGEPYHGDAEPSIIRSIRERATNLAVRIHGIAVGRAAIGIAGNADSILARWSDTICAVTDTTCDSAAVQALGRI